MAGRIRAHVWRSTSLGPIESWPQSLRTAVDLILPSGLPMAVLWGPELVQIYNDGYAALMGAEHPAGLGRPARERGPAARRIAEPVRTRVLAGETVAVEDAFEPTVRCAGSAGVSVKVTCSPLRDEAGDIAGALVTAIETSARAAEKLAFRRLFAAFPTPLLVLAPDPPRFTVTDANDAYLVATTADRDQVVGRGMLEACPEEPGDAGAADPDSLRASLERALSSGRPAAARRQRYDIPTPDGGLDVRWWDPINLPILDDQGRVVAIVHHVVDVTEQRRAERALHESDARFRELVEGIPQLVWRGVGGEWTWASPQWTAYTGQTEPDSRGWGWLEPVHPDDRDAARAAWTQARTTGGFDVEYRLRRAADGAYRWFRTRATPVRGRGGKIVEWLGTSTDIDDLRGLQERQQLLLAELQHRVRNTLSVVRSIARRTAASNATIEEYTAHFDGRLNAFARTQAAVTRDPPAGVDLEALIAEELLAHGAREGRQVRIDGPGLRLRPKAAETLGLAVHELATNAVKYGALSTPIGRLDVRWTIEGRGQVRRLKLEWCEDLAGRPVAPPRRRGFGLDMLKQTLAYDLGAETALDFAPRGLRCTIELPLDDGIVRS